MKSVSCTTFVLSWNPFSLCLPCAIFHTFCVWSLAQGYMLQGIDAVFVCVLPYSTLAFHTAVLYHLSTG